MLQIARDLTAYDGFLAGKRLLILDRDPLFTAAFRRTLKDSGVKPVVLPRDSPNLNAHAERGISSIKREALSRVVVLSERHLRKIVREFAAHYHVERNHQSLGSTLIEPDGTAGRTDGRVVCRKRLGGLLRYYYRLAA